MSGPLVIGHRGASGHRPEHTALAYKLAWRAGADSVEPDVVSTRDGVLLCRHDLDLARTTDIASRPEFASRRREVRLDDAMVQGWFVGDLDLAEIRTLRARERWPRRRPESARYDDRLPLLTLGELLDLRDVESARSGRRLGVHVELKEPEVFAALGLPLDELLVEELRRRRLTHALSPVTVMAFEASALKRLRQVVELPLVRLVDEGEHVRRRQLTRMASYADGVGLNKAHLRRGGDRRPAALVEAIHGAGLDALVWTLRGPGAKGAEQVRRLTRLGIDGLLTDYPAMTVATLQEQSTRVA